MPQFSFSVIYWVFEFESSCFPSNLINSIFILLPDVSIQWYPLWSKGDHILLYMRVHCSRFRVLIQWYPLWSKGDHLLYMIFHCSPTVRFSTGSANTRWMCCYWCNVHKREGCSLQVSVNRKHETFRRDSSGLIFIIACTG